MARGINKVLLIGFCGKDPELTFTQSGMAIAKFSLATTESRKNTQGNYEDKTSWHNIVLFDKTAETAGKYLAKGSQIYLEGSIDYQEWEKEGVKHYRTVITCFKMQMLGSKDGVQGDSQARVSDTPKPVQNDDDGEYDDDDFLPF